MTAPQASSRLEMLQARFQQRQLLEKEQKLLQLYDQQQLRAHQVAQRGSAGSNGSNSSGNGTSGTVSHHQTVTRTTTSTHCTANSQAGGKVRQMFDERRQTTVKGIDKSYPLEPLDNRSRKQQSNNATRNVAVSSTSPFKNGNPMSNRQSLVMRRTVRSEANSNVNGGKPIVSYQEEVSRESCGPTDDDNDQEEFGDDDDDQESQYANGNRHVDQRSEVHIEDITNENSTRRHRTTAKIHLSEVDSNNETNRIGDNLDNEQFSEEHTIEVPERLLRRAPPPKKPSQAEARLERFKNSNTKRAGQMTKQVAGNTTSFTKKRTETSNNYGSTSRASTVMRMEEEEETSPRARSTSPEFERTGNPRSSTPEERARKLTSPVVDRTSIVTKNTGISKVSQLTHKNSMDFYPRRKSEFEKSKTFRKLQLELGESSPEPAEPEEESPTAYTKQCRKRSSILDENIYNPGGRSSSSSPTNERNTSKGRRNSREKSPEYSESGRRSESPAYGRKSSATKKEMKTSSVQSHTYSSRRRSSSSSLTTERDTYERRRPSREISPEHPRSRRGSESPIYERKSTIKNEETKTTGGERHSTSVETDFYSSRLRSSSTRPGTDSCPSNGRRVSRERSPESPQSRKESKSPFYEKKSTVTIEEIKTTSDGVKTTGQESITSSSRRRSSSSSLAAARDLQKGRRDSREISPERPQSRRGSESPIYEQKLTTKSDETKTTCGRRHSTNVGSDLYSSRRRSSSTHPNNDSYTFDGRRVSREKSLERPQSRKGSESPVYERKSTGQESNIYSTRRRSSSSSLAAAQDLRKGRRDSREMSPERPQSRRGSENPIYEKKMTINAEETKTTYGGHYATSMESDLYSSRRRSSSTRPTNDRCSFDGRRVRQEKSLERPQSQKGSESPVHGRTSREQESNIYSSRRRSSSASPTSARDSQKGRRDSCGMSPERPPSRRGSESPVYRRRSTVTSEEIKTPRAGSKATSTERKVTSEVSTTRSESPICVRMTRKRSESPRRDFRRPSIDQEKCKVNTDSRRTSGGTLRSVELVKKLAHQGSSEKKTTSSTRQSLERKTTLEDVEFQTSESRQRSKSPPQRVVKKDKVVRDVTKEDKLKNKDNGRKNSNEPKERTVRSRSGTASPSPTPSSTMQETVSFRAKKTERKNSSEAKRIDSKHRQREEKVNVINKTNLSHKKARNCDLTNVIRSPSPVEDGYVQSRRSSAEITVKRYETFKVNKPSQRFIKIECENSVNQNDESPIDKSIKADTKDKSQLLERIEKIRTTLSKSGRSEQNLQESKDFERTDSVESALKRFDSIGVETEHHVTVGVDEIDRSPVSPSLQPVHPCTKEISSHKERIAMKSVDSRSKSSKITVAAVKTQQRGMNPKVRDPSKEKVSRVNLRQKISEITKSVKAKKEKSVIPTKPRQCAKPRASQKITTSIVRKSKLRGEESSGRGEGPASDRSPECKRRLFDDSESEIDTDNSRSTIVLSSIARMSKSSGLVEIETTKNRDNLKIGSENMFRSESNLRETKSEDEQPTKILRSIEDIRKSIRRESQDFKRELNKFNTAMRNDEESSPLVSPDRTIVSCVKITKTLKPGYVAPVVKIERSTVKLPITHRVAKSPSPDIGVKRSTEGRARTPTSSVRKSVPSSPAKSPDASARYGSIESKSPGPRLLTRSSPSPSAKREDRIRSEVSRTTEYSDCTDGPADHSELTVTESVSSTTTKRNHAFVVDPDDDDVSRSNESASSSHGKPSLRKQSTEKSLISQKQQRLPSTTPLSRPASALSTSSTGSARGQTSQINSKSRMSTKTKTHVSTGSKAPPGSARDNTAAAANDGLTPCKICGRRFNTDRVTLHEQICSKTATKKRKQFDATVHRVKGTELEPFVTKKGGAKKAPTDRKTSKPEVKSNWRRKHEDFINAIRSAKQVQAHLAAGGKLSDLPPPPASDTSDYVQCPHCERKFNQAAAERHIPKCQNMMHNKPNPRAPPKPKR